MPIYGLSFLMPRSKRIWVLGSTFGKRFADNPKYFFLYLNQYRTIQIRAVWISKEKEVIKQLRDNQLEGYYLYSLKGIWFSLRSKVYLYDNYSKDICFPLSGGALKINLWHGIPLKKIQKDNRFDHVRNPKSRWAKMRWWLRRISDEKPSDYVLATSEFLRAFFESAFGTKHVIVSGYPRNDNLNSVRIQNVVTDQEKEMMEYVNLQKKECRIVFYLPTFRNSEADFFNVIDANRLLAFLGQEKILFIVKLHPKSKVKEKFKRLNGNHILVIDPVWDPYPVLSLTDVLVTDYSSVYFDFLLTGKQVIFFPYDLKEYLRDTREMYFDYEEFTPGVKAYDQDELEAAILHPVFYQKEKESILEKTYTDPEGFASEELYDNIMKILNQ